MPEGDETNHDEPYCCEDYCEHCERCGECADDCRCERCLERAASNAQAAAECGG